MSSFESPTTKLFAGPTITGAVAYTPGDFAEAIATADRGDVHLAAMVTRRIELDDAVTEGFERLAESPGDDVKVLITP